MQNAIRLLRFAIAASLLVSTALYVVWSRHWPLVGDASLIHYIVFLMQHGRAPYRDLGDMNLPWSFLLERLAMAIFGGGAAGWRVFDASLLVVAAASFAVVTRRAGWFAAVFAGTLFALIHGRDGMAQAGQRDLTMAVLLVASTAALFVAIRRRAWRGVLGFGVLAGAACSIKPTVFPLSVAQLVIAAWVMRVPLRPMSQKRDMGHPDRVVLHPVWTVGWALAGMLVAPLISLLFLLREHALGAFSHSLRTVVPYYQSLGHRPLSFLLAHSVSPVMALVLIWVAVLALARPSLDWQRGLLLCGVFFGLAAFVIQARGWPYHRYPLLVFLLPVMALDFSEAMERMSGRFPAERVAAGLAVVAVCVGGFFLGPQSAVQVRRIRWWQTDFISTLQQHLDALGGPELSGRVQCIDWFSGCGTTLYTMRLMPATGVLSDFLIFGPSDVAAVRDARAMFAPAFAHPPRVIAVSSVLEPSGPNAYGKLALWPELDSFLAERYRLDYEFKPVRTERWWSREELPAGFRIYVLR